MLFMNITALVTHMLLASSNSDFALNKILQECLLGFLNSKMLFVQILWIEIPRYDRALLPPR